ncbi:MAG: glycosyltransferase family 2 protein [Anaerolineae bacterium]|nr:glycosyltransferase family 2 protein [Anaerolineae bacterium]
MKKNIVRIAIVIPLYRAEKHIGAVLRGIPAYISHIVIVDDCSPDQSVEIVQNCSDARICLISHQTNQGVGGAVLTGYKKAVELGAEIIVKMDSDDQMDPAYLLSLLAPILTGQADYTKGNRFLHINELQNMPFIRRMGNAGLSFLTKVASGYWNIFDPTNGYTAIHSSITSLLETKKIHKRYFFESSMLIELGIIRAVIQDIHIPARYQDETSSLSEWKVLFEFPPLLLAGFMRRFFIQYFVRDFGIVSMLFLLGISFSLFGIIFGAYHWYLSSQLETPASTGTVMLAVLPLIMGFQLLIQALIADIQNIPMIPLQGNIKTLDKIRTMLG